VGRSPARPPQGIPDIAHEILEPGDSARVTALFLDESHIAKLAVSRGTRIGTWQSCRHVKFDLALEVIAKLLGQLVIDAATAKHGAEAQADGF
jgi:hypothetical protein